MLSLREVAALTHGEITSGDPAVVADRRLDVGSIEIDAVSTDSRRVPQGSLFVALAGERFDGHAFVDEVGPRGARAVLVERHRPAHGLPSIAVLDTRRALGDLAAGWRRRFRMPLVVVTGSNGKTTTKEMIAAILVAAYGDDSCATEGNLNNDIGVPLTLLRLRTHHRAAVIELGMNHPGETARLAEIAQPGIALIVNAQREHQEFMQSVAAVADEHALAIASLPVDGVAVFPAGDRHVAVWRRAAEQRRVVDFVCVAARDAEPSIAASVTGRASLETEDTVLHLDTPDGATSARISVPGIHNAHNATAAAAACIAAGVPLDVIRAGLEAFRPARGRTQRVVVAGGIVVIDDSYNANPDSMRAAIDLLASHRAPRLLVMGDMGEVGDDGPRFHAEIGAHARERGIEAVYATGGASRDSVDAFGAGGRHFETVEALIDAVHGWVAAHARAAGEPAGAIVVKGSRFMRMERVVAALVPDRIATAGAH